MSLVLQLKPLASSIVSFADFKTQFPGGQVLTFEPGGAALAKDQETGTSWNIFGTAVDGPLMGEQLAALPAHEFFWFAWAAFQPDTLIYKNAAGSDAEQVR